MKVLWSSGCSVCTFSLAAPVESIAAAQYLVGVRLSKSNSNERILSNHHFTTLLHIWNKNEFFADL